VSSRRARTLFNVLGTAISAAGSDEVTIVRCVGEQGAGGQDRAGAGEGRAG